MKRILSGVFAFLLLLSLLPTSLFATSTQAASVSNITFASNSYGTSYYVYDCSSYASGTLEIPATYNGKPVTRIGEYAFSGCKYLTSITIPDSVNTIDDYAFKDCTGLTGITIPDSVTLIRKNILSGCSSLEAVTIPSVDFAQEPNSYALSYSYQYPFGYFFGTSSYTGGVATEQHFLVNYTSGSSTPTCDTFYIPSSLKTVTVTMGDIPYGAFCNCTSLTNIKIPDSVTTVGDYAFRGCTSLTSIAIPNGIESIGPAMFALCTSLTSITIPDSVTSIGWCAFEKCTSLTSITIPDNVTSVDNYAFYGCVNLTNIIIGKNLSSIGQGAFWDCNNLINIYTNASAWCKVGDYFSDKYPPHFIDDAGNEITDIILDSSVTIIPSDCFAECSQITSITIPSSVLQSNYYAFYNCTSLNAVYIEDIAAWCNIEFVLGYSNPLFYAGNLYLNGELVTELILPDNVTTIKYKTFTGCAGLTDVVIPDHITTIEENAFVFCKNLTSITIPDSVTTIGYGAFSGCTSLTSVTFGNNITNIGTCAFNNCDKIEDVWYLGTASDRDNIAIDDYGNTFLEEATWHYSVWVVDQEETCGESGAKHEECTVCGKVRDKYTIIPATGNHNYDNAYSTECNICNYTRTVYSITFDVNAGTGTIETLPKEYGITAVLPSQTPYRTGYCFTGWATSKRGEVEYLPGDDFSKDQTLTLYAQWDLVCANCSGNGATTHDVVCTICSGAGGYYKACGICGGLGSYQYTTSQTCIRCNGSGKLWDSTNGSVTRVDCDRCGGAGEVYSTHTTSCEYCPEDGYYYYSCTSCDGNGFITKSTQCATCDGSGNYPRTTVAVPSAPILESKTETSIVLQPIANGEYSIDGENWQDSPVFENLETGKQYNFYQRYAKTDTTYASDASVVLVAIPEPPLHTIIFEDWDGTIISKDTYHYGGKVTEPTNPTKAADSTYSYAFKGWDKAVVDCAGDATYTATYTPTYINYTVTFKDWNGTVLSSKTYHYGDTVTAPANPYRPDDDANIYTFVGWDRKVVACNGNAVYTALYSSQTRVPSVITSTAYAVTGTTISKVGVGTTADVLVSNLNEGAYVKIFSADQEVAADSQIGTGMVVKIMDGDVVKATYTIVVTGDTSGDGNISIMDFVQLKSHLLNKDLLEGACGQAADTNGDGNISIMDFVNIKAHLLGKSQIEPLGVSAETSYSAGGSSASASSASTPAVPCDTTVCDQVTTGLPYTHLQTTVPEKKKLIIA